MATQPPPRGRTRKTPAPKTAPITPQPADTGAARGASPVEHGLPPAKLAPADEHAKSQAVPGRKGPVAGMRALTETEAWALIQIDDMTNSRPGLGAGIADLELRCANERGRPIHDAIKELGELGLWQCPANAQNRPMVRNLITTANGATYAGLYRNGTLTPVAEREDIPSVRLAGDDSPVKPHVDNRARGRSDDSNLDPGPARGVPRDQKPGERLSSVG
jgi:hypothetical protein